MLLSTAYFPPIEYIAAIADGMVLSPDRVVPSVVYIDANENYQKQSYRNRCLFYADDGVQFLNMPIVHDGVKLISEIKLDYSTPWVVRTQRAIASAYENSAYFEYYKDELFEIMDSRPEKLFDLNMLLLKFFLEKTGVSAEVRLTSEYLHHEDAERLLGPDLREVIHPKRPNTILEDLGLKKTYFQVFAQKYGFKSNLSIMDLLFNEGPDSIVYLKTL